MKRIIGILLLVALLVGCTEEQRELEEVDLNTTEINEYINKDVPTSKGQLEKLKENLEEVQAKAESLQRVRECSKICLIDGGWTLEDVTPVVENEFYMACQQAYYYGGTEALEGLIASCENSE